MSKRSAKVFLGARNLSVNNKFAKSTVENQYDVLRPELIRLGQVLELERDLNPSKKPVQ